MSQDTETLEREVQSRRSNLESTIEELRSRMSVGQIIDELSGYMREGQAGVMAQNLGRQVRDNPLALGLVGAGIAWLLLGDRVRDHAPRAFDRYDDDDDVGRRMSQGRGGSSDDLAFGNGTDGGSDWMQPAADASGGTGGDSSSSGVTDRLKSAASAVSSGFASVSGSAGSAASSARQSARRFRHDAADRMTEMELAALQRARSVGRGARRMHGSARNSFVDVLQEEPLVIGALALVVGAAVGASLPSTRIEDEYLGDARDGMRNRAMDYGKEALESGKRVAERAYEAAGKAADEEGLTPSGEGKTLAEKVANVAGAAAQTAKSEAQKEGLV